MASSEEVTKILHELGYYESDSVKTEQVKNWAEEAEEFLKEAGVKDTLLTSKRAFAFKSIYSDLRNRGETNGLEGNPILLNIISQLKRMPSA